MACSWAPLVAQMVKNLLAMQEMWVRSLDQEDPLEEEMATHSSILAWEIPWKRSLVGYSPWGHKRVRHDWATNTFTFVSCSWEGAIVYHLLQFDFINIYWELTMWRMPCWACWGRHDITSWLLRPIFWILYFYLECSWPFTLTSCLFSLWIFSGLLIFFLIN